MRIKVEWTTRAVDSLNRYCSFIEIDSPVSAKKVRKEIVLTSKKLSMNPNLFQLDEYYLNNPGNIRRFFRWSYKIVYLVKKENIVILDIYHTSRNPIQELID